MKIDNFAAKAIVSFFFVLRKNPVPAVAVAVIGLLAYMVKIAANAISSPTGHLALLTGLMSLIVLAAIVVLLIVKHPPAAARRK